MSRVTAIEPGAWDDAAQVAFHDAECHGYSADLPVWRALAAAEAGPVLDVGAGTGRVALDLAAAGHDVVALDTDPVLLAALTARAGDRDLRVRTVAADAGRLAQAGGRLDGLLGDAAGAFGLVLVPMQTVQLLPDRPAFLAGVRRVLAPGGLAALAIADELLPFDGARDVTLPDPDVTEAGGWRYESQPVAVRLGPAGARIERVRTAIAPDGARTAADDLIELAALGVATLAAEGAAAGLAPQAPMRIAPTDDHVGSAVVLLRG